MSILPIFSNILERNCKQLNFELYWTSGFVECLSRFRKGKGTYIPGALGFYWKYFYRSQWWEMYNRCILAPSSSMGVIFSFKLFSLFCSCYNRLFCYLSLWVISDVNKQTTILIDFELIILLLLLVILNYILWLQAQ